MTQQESPADPRAVWDRLRSCFERFQSSQEQATDPARLALKLAHRAKLLHDRVSTTIEQPTTPFLTFHSGHERFGIPIGDVVEIQALDHYSPVPKTPSFIVGVIPWHGTILTLIDLGRLFGIPESGIADYHVCIIVEAAGRRIAIVTREVEDILAITADQMKPLPDLSGDVPADWIVGVHDRNRMLLNPARILADERLTHWRTSEP